MSEEKIKIFSVVFGGEGFQRLANALKKSIEKNSPQAEFELKRLDETPENPGLPAFYWDNYLKSRAWRDAVKSATGPLVLLDADAIVLRGFDEAFEQDFDVGYTRRQVPRSSIHPINSGVVFVQPTEMAKKFIYDWQEIVEAIMSLGDDAQIERHVDSAKGVHQAGLRDLLWDLYRTDRDRLARVKPFPCWQWNCEQFSWKKFSKQKTVVVHVKSALRPWLLHKTLPKKAHVRRNAQPVYAACKQYYE